jgi:opacity protein-like surface antigen
MPGSLRTFAARTSFSVTSTAMLTAMALLADSANAADLSMPMRAPPPLLAFSWTGFYIGADVGYAWGKDTTTEYVTATNTFTGFNPTYNINSAVGGLYAGYNYQIGSAVLGIESDIEAANIRGGFIDPVVGGAGTTQLEWQGSLRGRLGFTADKCSMAPAVWPLPTSVTPTPICLQESPRPPRDCVRAGPQAPESRLP